MLNEHKMGLYCSLCLFFSRAHSQLLDFDGKSIENVSLCEYLGI